MSHSGLFLVTLAPTALYAPRFDAARTVWASRPDRSPQGFVQTLVRGPVLVLQKLHSGHLGDYVAWLLVGVAGIAALAGLAP